MIAEMDHYARQRPEELIYELIASGFVTLGYDGQPFFDKDHLSSDAAGGVVTLGNVDDGTEPDDTAIPGTFRHLAADQADHLAGTQDLRRATIDRSNEPNVFVTDEYLSGTRARVSAGFGLWQSAYASRAPLTLANYTTARR